MLNRHLLLALATMAVERLKQHGEGAGELAGMREILTPRLAHLLTKFAPGSSVKGKAYRLASH